MRYSCETSSYLLASHLLSWEFWLLNISPVFPGLVQTRSGVIFNTVSCLTRNDIMVSSGGLLVVAAETTGSTGMSTSGGKPAAID